MLEIKDFKTIIEKSPRYKTVAYLRRKMLYAQKNYFYEPKDYIEDLQITLLAMKNVAIEDFEREREFAKYWLDNISVNNVHIAETPDYTKQHFVEDKKKQFAETLQKPFIFEYEFLESALKELIREIILQKDNNSIPKELDTPEAKEPKKIINKSTNRPVNKSSTLQKPDLTSESVELLKSYFISTFKGMGKSQNKFDEMLLPDLKKKRTKKELAAISLLLYESDIIIPNKRPKTFTKWNDIFFSLIHVEQPTYKPAHLNKIKKPLEIEFYYLKTLVIGG